MSKIKAVPEYNYMFLTCNKTQTTTSGIILTGDSIVEDEQVILKVGESVRTLKPGMRVKIDPRPYLVKNWNKTSNIEEDLMKQTIGIAWPIEEVDGVEIMIVPDNHIRWHWPLEEGDVSRLN